MIRYNPHIKRSLDILLSSAAVLVLSPLFAIVSILICIESAGGAFFFQRRIGKGMEPFQLVKFRSMRRDSDALLRQFEPGERSRVTRLGGFLRKTKLDELPELFNVLFGDMSIVGPRPEVEKYVQTYPAEFGAILSVRPGLSDYASIKYRNEEGILAKAKDPEQRYLEEILPDKLRMAKEYVERMSFGTDMKIVARTIRTISKTREAEK
jgi:lipopolysaccharide/colanic/teichoic acid biosynthesis glycosyltransferase